jgi:iron(III) transport system permease protein
LLFVFFIVFISKYFGANSNTLASKTAETFQKIELNKFNQYMISTTCLSIFVLVFCIPVIQLLVWHFDNLSFNVSESLYLLFNSSILGVCAALFTVFFAMALSLSYKSNSYIRPFISISSSGYAVPGSVISAALLIVFDFVFDTSITLYGVFGLILCLSLRFMTPAFNYINASLTNISKSAENALSTQPRNSYKAFRLFYLPQMKPAVLLSIMIVFIESIKEQPATLLLRPVGFDTLSTKIYNFTSEGQWEMASTPSLFLIALSLVFVYLINKNIDLNKNT